MPECCCDSLKVGHPGLTASVAFFGDTSGAVADIPTLFYADRIGRRVSGGDVVSNKLRSRPEYPKAVELRNVGGGVGFSAGIAKTGAFYEIQIGQITRFDTVEGADDSGFTSPYSDFTFVAGDASGNAIGVRYDYPTISRPKLVKMDSTGAILWEVETLADFNIGDWFEDSREEIGFIDYDQNTITLVFTAGRPAFPQYDQIIRNYDLSSGAANWTRVFGREFRGFGSTANFRCTDMAANAGSVGLIGVGFNSGGFAQPFDPHCCIIGIYSLASGPTTGEIRAIFDVPPNTTGGTVQFNDLAVNVPATQNILISYDATGADIAAAITASYAGVPSGWSVPTVAGSGQMGTGSPAVVTWNGTVGPGVGSPASTTRGPHRVTVNSLAGSGAHVFVLDSSGNDRMATDPTVAPLSFTQFSYDFGVSHIALNDGGEVFLIDGFTPGISPTYLVKVSDAPAEIWRKRLHQDENFGIAGMYHDDETANGIIVGMADNYLLRPVQPLVFG